jgi:hypothetical protein
MCHNYRPKTGGSLLHDEDERRRFVLEILKTFRERCSEAITNGLFRVDIMYSKGLKKMVLNEFESFEASFEANKIEKDALVVDHLELFWDKTIGDMADKFYDRYHS